MQNWHKLSCKTKRLWNISLLTECCWEREGNRLNSGSVLHSVKEFQGGYT